MVFFMAWTQTDLDELEADIKAISSGSFKERGVQYRPLDELLRLRDVMRRELGVSGSNSFDDRARQAKTSKGT